MRLPYLFRKSGYLACHFVVSSGLQPEEIEAGICNPLIIAGLRP